MVGVGKILEWVASRRCDTPEDAHIQAELLGLLNDLHYNGVLPDKGVID